MRTPSACFVLLFLAAIRASALQVRTSVWAANEKSGVRVAAGALSLPGRGGWRIIETDRNPGPLSQLQLKPPEKSAGHPQAGTVSEPEAARRQKRDRPVRTLRMIRYACAQFARGHGGVGPGSIDELDPQRYRYQIASCKKNPWPEKPKLAPPFFFLVPNVRFNTRKLENQHRSNADAILAFELQPYVDDGKHWVVTAGGKVRRRRIDPQLLKKYGVRVTPVSRGPTPGTAAVQAARYRIYGLLTGKAAGELLIRLENVVTHATVSCRWPLDDLKRAPPTIVAEWAEARALHWLAIAQRTQSPILEVWLSRCKDLYGTTDFGYTLREAMRRENRFGRATSAFNVFGGRAALRETLQLQAPAPVRSGAAPRRGAETPIGQIAGVRVKPHPFAEMLQGSPGGRLPLADCVPPDRFFVYVAHPGKLSALLERGGAFLAEVTVSFSRNPIWYNLEDRYLTQLGMNRQWVARILDSGLVAELALVFPDLFFVDGTDVTCIARVSRELSEIEPLLRLIRVPALEEGKIVACLTRNGVPVFWAVSGRLLFIGTNRREVRRCLDLHRHSGAGSLGNSPEFRYMVTQLPVAESTRAYAYFSDPFIRRLVGPAVKIGQLRRLRARATLEAVAAGALLYRLDGHSAPPSTEELIRRGYVANTVSAADFRIEPDGTVTSIIWGSPARPTPLSAHPVDEASDEEVAAYKRYVADYSRFWRQYFDPIAVRLDDCPDGALELTTFILPLLNSSIYRGLRQAIPRAESHVALRCPTIRPAPILEFSISLGDRVWTEFLGKYKRMFTYRAGPAPALFENLGPSVHLCVADADPIIALGSGDILGAFGGDAAFLGRGVEMAAVPILFSVLTRPCLLMVELKDAEKVRALLRGGALGAFARPPTGDSFGFEVSVYRVGESDSWVYAVRLAGAVALRFGVAVQGRYLVVRNLPWQPCAELVGEKESPLNGLQLHLNPGVVERQLPALFMVDCEHRRQAAMRGIGYLYPLMLGRRIKVPAAAAQCARLFGFTPVHPGKGAWQWKGHEIVSTQFGSLFQQKQPDYRAGARDFGLFADIREMNLCLQFEKTGLRTRCRWRPHASSGPKDTERKQQKQ